MLSKKLITEVENLIGEGKTEEAFKKLSTSTTIKRNENLKKHLILLSSQWNNHKRDKVEGIKSEAFLNRQLNKINSSVISFVHGNIDEKGINKSNGDAKKSSSAGNTITGIIVGACLILLAYFLFQPEPTPTPVPTKPVLNEYLISVLDNQGYQTDKFVAKIYRDLTGEIIYNGNPAPMQTVNKANRAILDFTFYNGQSMLNYRGMYDLTHYSFEGKIFSNKQPVGKWSGTILEK